MTNSYSLEKEKENLIHYINYLIQDKGFLIGNKYSLNDKSIPVQLKCFNHRTNTTYYVDFVIDDNYVFKSDNKSNVELIPKTFYNKIVVSDDAGFINESYITNFSGSIIMLDRLDFDIYDKEVGLKIGKDKHTQDTVYSLYICDIFESSELGLFNDLDLVFRVVDKLLFSHYSYLKKGSDLLNETLELNPEFKNHHVYEDVVDKLVTPVVKYTYNPVSNSHSYCLKKHTDISDDDVKIIKISSDYLNLYNVSNRILPTDDESNLSFFKYLLRQKYEEEDN